MRDSLSPEILDMIFTEVVKLLNPLQRDKNYSSFSLVCRNWTGVAFRKLLFSLIIRDWSQLKKVLSFMERNTICGKQVKLLEVDFQRHVGSNNSNDMIPTHSEIEEYDMLGRKDFIRLMKSLPNVITLRLNLPTFTQFRPHDARNASILSNLVILHLKIASYDNNLEILEQILQIAPKLQDLSLDGSISNDFSIPNLINCPQLRSLKLLSIEISNMAINPVQPLIPFHSYIGMKELELAEFYTQNQLPDYLKIISIAGPSLTSFKFNTCLRYSVIKTILSFLPLVKVLRIDCFDLGEDFFDFVPSSLEILESLELSIENLQHLKDSTKANSCSVKSFRLEQDFHTSNNDLLLQLLPSSLTSITICFSRFRSLFYEIETNYNFRNKYQLKLDEIIVLHGSNPQIQKSFDKLKPFSKSIGINLIQAVKI